MCSAWSRSQKKSVSTSTFTCERLRRDEQRHAYLSRMPFLELASWHWLPVKESTSTRERRRPLRATRSTRITRPAYFCPSHHRLSCRWASLQMMVASGSNEFREKVQPLNMMVFEKLNGRSSCSERSAKLSPRVMFKNRF